MIMVPVEINMTVILRKNLTNEGSYEQNLYWRGKV